MVRPGGGFREISWISTTHWRKRHFAPRSVLGLRRMSNRIHEDRLSISRPDSSSRSSVSPRDLGGQGLCGDHLAEGVRRLGRECSVRGTLTTEDLGQAWEPVEESWNWTPSFRIAGGNDEILRNILAERVLGLPQDVRVDRDISFDTVHGVTNEIRLFA